MLIKNFKSTIYLVLLTLSLIPTLYATENHCNKVCFPQKIYAQCTVNSRSLTLEERRQCDKMTADCRSCKTEHQATIKSSANQCHNTCDINQLLRCHKEMDTLSIDEKAECAKITQYCHTCTQERKAQVNQSKHPCTDVCDTEKLIECNKKFDTLTTEQKAFCTKLTDECQDCAQVN